MAGDVCDMLIGGRAARAVRGRTAEMLAIPSTVCARRCCRRSKRCQMDGRGTSTPLCYHRLPGEEIRTFDRLAYLASELYHAAQNDLIPALRRWYGSVARPEDIPTLYEIVRHALPPGDPGHARLAAFLRAEAQAAGGRTLVLSRSGTESANGTAPGGDGYFSSSV